MYPLQVGGVAPVGPRRAYCPPLEKMEAGLELVREAGTECGLILGQDFSVVVDIGADRLFDQVCAVFVCLPQFVRGERVCAGRECRLVFI